MVLEPVFDLAPDDSLPDILWRDDCVLAIRLKSSLVADLGGGFPLEVAALMDFVRVRIFASSESESSSSLSAHDPLYDEPYEPYLLSSCFDGEPENEDLQELSRKVWNHVM